MKDHVISEDYIALDAYTASIVNLRKGSIIKVPTNPCPMLGIVKADVVWKGMIINKVLISENLFKE